MLVRQRREAYSELKAWRSSHVVLANEIQYRVRKLLEEAVEDMGRQDRDISEDEDHLAAHEQQKIADADRIAILRAAVSGVRNIPPETFGEIFASLKEGCVELPPKKGGYSFP